MKAKVTNSRRDYKTRAIVGGATPVRTPNDQTNVKRRSEFAPIGAGYFVCISADKKHDKR